MAGRLQIDFSYQKNLNSIKLPNSKLYFYDSGTDTLSTIYSDESLSVTQTNPVTADSNGDFNNIYLTAGNSIYKIVLKDEKGVTVWTSDNDQPSLNTSIIPLVPGEYDFIFWIESTPEVGSRLEFNSTNVPTLSEASISSNTAIENKTQTNLTVTGGQSYPLTNIVVTASTTGAISDGDKVYFTYSGVDAAYKADNVVEVENNSVALSEVDANDFGASGLTFCSMQSNDNLIFTSNQSSPYGCSVFKNTAGTLSSGTVSGTQPTTINYGTCINSSYGLIGYGTSNVLYYTISGTTLTNTSQTGISLGNARFPHSSDDGTYICLYNFGSPGSIVAYNYTGSNTFSSMTISGGNPNNVTQFGQVSPVNISKNGTYICAQNREIWERSGGTYSYRGTTDTADSGDCCAISNDGVYFVLGDNAIGSNNLYLYKWNGSQYVKIKTVNTGDFVRTLDFKSDSRTFATGAYCAIINSDDTVTVSTGDPLAIDTSEYDIHIGSSYLVLSGQDSTSPTYNELKLFSINTVFGAQYTFDVSSTIATEPDSGKVFASPSSATTSEFDCGDTATTITVKSKFSPTSVTVDGSTTSTSLVTDDSGIISGDYVMLSTDGLTPYYGQVGTTTVSVGGGKATYTSDITSIGIGSAPVDCFTGNIVSYSSVQSSSGSPSYTTDTYSSIERDGNQFEITYTTRSVSGRYVQLKTDFDYIDSLDKFYAGLND